MASAPAATYSRSDMTRYVTGYSKLRRAWKDLDHSQRVVESDKVAQCLYPANSIICRKTAERIRISLYAILGSKTGKLIHQEDTHQAETTQSNTTTTGLATSLRR